jgi:hypothetical protein
LYSILCGGATHVARRSPPTRPAPPNAVIEATTFLTFLLGTILGGGVLLQPKGARRKRGVRCWGMPVVSAVADGCRRVLRAPLLIGGLWLIGLLVPTGVDLTLADIHAAVIDATAIDPMPSLITVIPSSHMWAHAALLTFLLGGVMDRLARDRATASFGFFGACGMFFFRFLRLAVLSVPLYYALLRWVYPRLPADEQMNSVIVLVLLSAVQLVFDYAKVRMVVEDRRGVFGAVAASLRFVRRNALAVLALSAINAGLAALTWWLGATSGIGTTAAIYAYWLARVLLRLVFIASAIALFQSRLAHAGYTARPVAAWPDSPGAEAVLPR